MKKLKQAAIGFLLLTSVNEVCAAEIQIINETGRDLTIQIEGQETMGETKYTKPIPAQYESALMIVAEELGGAKLYDDPHNLDQ